MRGEGSLCETGPDAHYDIACAGGLTVPDASVDLVSAERGPGRDADCPGEVIARDLQLDWLSGLRLDAALHDGGGLECREERIDQPLGGKHSRLWT